MDMATVTYYGVVAVMVYRRKRLKTGTTCNVFNMGLVFAFFASKTNLSLRRNPYHCWLVQAVKNTFAAETLPGILVGLGSQH